MTMNAAEVMTLHRQALHTPADAPGSAQGRGQGRTDGRTQGDGAGFVELVPAPKDRGGFVADDFADVIDHLQGTAHHIRRLEGVIRHLQQNKFCQERLEDELKTAMNRAAHAELRAFEAENKIEALEKRAVAAEDRARQVEKWLVCIQQTVRNEFSDVSI